MSAFLIFEKRQRISKDFCGVRQNKVTIEDTALLLEPQVFSNIFQAFTEVCWRHVWELYLRGQFVLYESDINDKIIIVLQEMEQHKHCSWKVFYHWLMTRFAQVFFLNVLVIQRVCLRQSKISIDDVNKLRDNRLTYYMVTDSLSCLLTEYLCFRVISSVLMTQKQAPVSIHSSDKSIPCGTWLFWKTRSLEYPFSCCKNVELEQKSGQLLRSVLISPKGSFSIGDWGGNWRPLNGFFFFAKPLVAVAVYCQTVYKIIAITIIFKKTFFVLYSLWHFARAKVCDCAHNNL